ncbi:MAG: SDR family oxidoreductase [Rhodospirillales bacterium]|jgi:nucleoside-diphosphate-sugar epimerase|nr:SDR family oxidoreductase [Rhodospirillales bacterium]MDP7652097.1 SDR family oxidoreductase [Rhodospirillales bacterium]HJO97148.1 SDR family oxidoreductase [Rhodospirillales bacterium]
MIEDLPAGRLFCFGLGYTAGRLARILAERGWIVGGTCQGLEARAELAAKGIEALLFDGAKPLAKPAAGLDGVTHILSSVPPGIHGDPVLAHHAGDIAACRELRWVGYLSTTGVYGDTGGAEVDEAAPLDPTSERGRRRVDAEAAWLRLHNEHGVPVHVFRLAGIYGPGRSALDQVRGGRARRIDKPGQAFSRIHVDDIAAVLRSSMGRPRPGAVYNVCDDEAAPPADVIAFACDLLGVEAPPVIPFTEAEGEMSEMARTFWRDNRRVKNRLLKDELGVCLAHPDYRAGLKAIMDDP